jgi:hypothetical protein
MLTQEILKTYLTYDPLTGLFSRTENCLHKNNTKKTKVGTTIQLGYIRIHIYDGSYRAHRLAFLFMIGRFPNGVVDHIDGNPSNNKWENLREVTISENAQNAKIDIRNKVGASNICFDKARNKYMVRIYLKGECKFFGRYESLEDAKKVAKEQKEKIHIDKNYKANKLVESVSVDR